MHDALPLLCFGKEYVRVAWLSPEDHAWAAAIGNWHVTPSGYAARSMGGRLVFLHKQVLVRAMRLPPSSRHTIGDHLNGTRLDCRRPNLRWATPQQNALNRFGQVLRQLVLFPVEHWEKVDETVGLL